MKVTDDPFLMNLLINPVPRTSPFGSREALMTQWVASLIVRGLGADYKPQMYTQDECRRAEKIYSKRADHTVD